MKVHFVKERKDITSKATSVKELLEELKINHTTVLVVRNGKLVTLQAQLKKQDEIIIYPVISGG